MAKNMNSIIEPNIKNTSNVINSSEKNSNINLQTDNLLLPENFTSLNKITKIKLNKLFPGPLHIISTVEEQHHYIDLYRMSKDTLFVHISDLDEKPMNMNFPFSDFSKWIDNFYDSKACKIIDNGDEMQIIKYQTKRNLSLVLKRFTCYFNSSNINQEVIKQYEAIIESKYIEYSLMKLFNGCNFSAQPIAFNIIQIPKQNKIGTELLMYYGGDPFYKLFPILDMNILNRLFIQACQALNFLQNYRIEQNDLKPGNILVEKNGDSIILRLIDFDIGRYKSLTEKTQVVCKPSGYTSYYVSPEILTQEKMKNANSKEINSWKSQIYSLGVVFLEALGFFKHMDITSFDQYKVSDKKYNDFLKILQKFSDSIGKEENLKKNLVTILKFCLNYDAAQRPSTKALLVLLKDIENKDLKGIEKEYSLLKSTFNNKEQEYKINLEDARKISEMYMNKEIRELNNHIHEQEQAKIRLKQTITNYEKKIQEYVKTINEKDLLIKDKENKIKEFEKLAAKNTKANNIPLQLTEEKMNEPKTPYQKGKFYNYRNSEFFEIEQYSQTPSNTSSKTNRPSDSTFILHFSDLLKGIEKKLS